MTRADLAFTARQLTGAAWLVIGGLVRLAHDHITRRNR